MVATFELWFWRSAWGCKVQLPAVLRFDTLLPGARLTGLRGAVQRPWIMTRENMKYWIVALLAGAMMLSVSTDANAQDDDEIQTRFYDFSDLLIDGDLLRPDGMFATARDRARFDSLLSLRRSFLPEIDEAAKESALQ